MTAERGRIPVATAPPGDRRWQQYGRTYFLSRQLFEQWLGNCRSRAQPFRLYSSVPVLDALVALTFMLLPFWLLWQLTEWACPPAASVVRRAIRHAHRLAWWLVRWLQRIVWRRPADRYGVAVAAWLSGVVLVVIGVITSLATGRVSGLAWLLPLVLVLVVLWFALRAWRQRLYRPRPLPGRRRRNRYG